MCLSCTNRATVLCSIYITEDWCYSSVPSLLVPSLSVRRKQEHSYCDKRVSTSPFFRLIFSSFEWNSHWISPFYTTYPIHDRNSNSFTVLKSCESSVIAPSEYIIYALLIHKMFRLQNHCIFLLMLCFSDLCRAMTLLFDVQSALLHSLCELFDSSFLMFLENP